ncbi:Sensor histidine kinase RegB [Hartmannibacter diazotrophicus]|uniref:histidine kinase n=1 Tax=Hartmannibacter diazotrophicus TaxID=1482074 RepID=A0A2C9DD08_9HYPH|nr:ATP-binding protein [Hartmannibacter diazotrophicus]SON58060.1 Sensor histidine kinase RegB [Hartmannibacter diazotrophicus]
MAAAGAEVSSDSRVLVSSDRQNLLFLIQLRWLAVVGQVMTILAVHFGFGIALPLMPMAGVILFIVACNLAALLRYRSQEVVTKPKLFVELLLDVTALTMLLYLSGGATNPFVSLYLLQVILGTILFDVRWCWVLVLLTSGCYLVLTELHRPLLLPEVQGDMINLHQHGRFLSFLLIAVLLVVFISRINANLRARDARLSKLHEQAIQEDHIIRMGLLASGAAHELGTPLATLSVILNDWQRMPQLGNDDLLAEEIDEMQAQVARCKAIVSGILLSAGEARGEGTVRSSVNAFLDNVVVEWHAGRSQVYLDYANLFGDDVPIVADTALKQVVFNILDNAADVSPQWVGVVISRRGNQLVISVRDRGPGFAEDILDDVGKPYRSTKGRPGGGLGLFLVTNVARKLGGSFTARNLPEGGALVEIALPLAAFAPGDGDPDDAEPGDGNPQAQDPGDRDD